MFLFFLLRSLLTTVLRRTQKHRSKKRSGAAQENPPFASCMTRHATALDAKHASAALPAGAGANGGGAPRKTLLTVLRMARGGDRVDKRGLPAEQGKGVNTTPVQTGASHATGKESRRSDSRECLVTPGFRNVRGRRRRSQPQPGGRGAARRAHTEAEGAARSGARQVGARRRAGRACESSRPLALAAARAGRVVCTPR